MNWQECNNIENKHLMICEKCNILPSKSTSDPKYNWLIQLDCGNCGASWSICKICKGMRKRIYERKYVNQHHKLHDMNEKKRKSDLMESNYHYTFSSDDDTNSHSKKSTISCNHQMSTEDFYNFLKKMDVTLHHFTITMEIIIVISLKTFTWMKVLNHLF